MSDHVVVTQKTSPLGTSNLAKNPIVGVLLLVAAFGLLIWGEKKVDVSQLAATSVEVSSDAVSDDQSLQGKFVSVTGPLTSTEALGDGDYLKPGPYLAVERTVEMYSWIERKSTTPGSDGTETVTYDYVKDWTNNPLAPSAFQERAGHENPVLLVPQLTKKVTSAKVGAYFIDPASATLPGMTQLTLSNENIYLVPRAQFADGNTLFIGQGTSFSPVVGDLRIRYKVLPVGKTMTVFGALQGQRLATFVDPSGTKVYQVAAGDRATALSSLASAEVMMTWVIRVVGLLLMWGGLISLLQKFMAAASPGSVKMIALVVALILTVGAVFIGASI